MVEARVVGTSWGGELQAIVVMKLTASPQSNGWPSIGVYHQEFQRGMYDSWARIWEFLTRVIGVRG